ncbi:glycoside hydrolase family 97 catalytic domain-containing protein [Haloarcula amylovorans]|uniref:glycoside hydrolase family 97 catalytic domain-containing protein n=1 Tax=Haloarcula amylovorans TaxID=2562280 RepID=UPI001075E645|nr:glycoside hydrolase family 97 catalytic domain-containing protein [Halomicroarcula amylolytica]
MTNNTGGNENTACGDGTAEGKGSRRSVNRRGFIGALAGFGAATSLPLGASDATAKPIASGPIQSSYTVQSPDNTVAFEITLDGTELRYSVSFDGRTVIADSNLGVTLGNGELNGNLSITGSQTTSHDETWQPVWGGFSGVRNHYTQLELGVETTDSPRRRLTLECRVFDDGIGFRYVFPQQPNLDEFAINSEHTGFEFVEDYESWWIPNDWDNYEYFYFNTPISQVDAGIRQNHDKTADPLPVNEDAVDAQGVNTPVTLKAAEDCYLSIHEAALTDYAGMTLAQTTNGTPKFESALVPRPDGSKVWATAPHASPWRTIQLGRSPGDLIESRLILNLNEPCKIEDTSWIEPQKYCGPWWDLHIGKSDWPNSGDSTLPVGARTDNVKQYMDFASEHGIGAVLAEGWNKNYDMPEKQDYTESADHFDHREAWDYGQSLDPPVEFMAHNETLGNVDNLDSQIDAAYSWYGREPINSIKTGYVGEDNVTLNDEVHHHHDQSMVKHYRRVVTTAADNQLLLNAHEPIKPTGVRRTFPNFMTREGAAGLEYQNFSLDGVNPTHTVTTPFTRMLAGPIDHCPGIFDVFYDEYTGGLQADPDCRVHTTRTRQLAHYPMFLSGLQMVSDLPEYYTDGADGDWSQVLPEFAYVRDAPVDWDETRVPTAEIGQYVAIARRDSDEWWIGVATDDQARTIDVPLEFLDDDIAYATTVYSDAGTADFETNPMDVREDEFVVEATETLTASMVYGGGQALRLEPATNAQVSSLPRYSSPEQDDYEVTITEEPIAGERFITVGGTNDGSVVGGERFEIRVDGEVYDEVLVRISPDGSTFEVPTTLDELGAHEIAVGPVDEAPIATRTVSVQTDLPLGDPVAKWEDPKGDDDGPGSYYYPLNGWFTDGAFDIATFEVRETDERYQFLYTIHGELMDPRAGNAGFTRGFSVQLPELYVRDPTANRVSEATQARDGVNAELAEPYHYRFENIEGTTQVQPRVAAADGSVITEDVNVYASSAVDAIMFDVPKNVFGPIRALELCPLMLAEDDSRADRTRPIISTETWENGASWKDDFRFGGGRDDEMNPNIIDMITPDGVNQSDALAYSADRQARLPMVKVSKHVSKAVRSASAHKQ